MIDLAAILRDAGLDVVEVDGWQSRGGALTSVLGVVCHHTATPPSWTDGSVANLLVAGRPDLKGPLAQLGLARDGRHWIISGNRCSHNGYGTWGNSSVGIEAFNDGKGEPWPPEQIVAYQRGAAAILRHFNLGVDRCQAHREQDPGRKVDPVGIDMDAFRNGVAHYLANPEDDMPLSDADKTFIDATVAKWVNPLYQFIEEDNDENREALKQQIIRARRKLQNALKDDA